MFPKNFNVVKFDEEKQCDHLTFVTKTMMKLQMNCLYNDVAIVMQN